jgi:Undecaprenyl-phosphate galactose phosphotransferase WbaP
MTDVSPSPAAARPPPQRRRADFPAWLGVLSDTVAVGASALAAFLLLICFYSFFGSGFVTLSRLVSERLQFFSVATACIVLWFFLNGHHHRRMPFWSEAKEVVQACCLGLLGEGFLLYSGKADVSRLLTFATWAVAPLAIMGLRYATKSLARRRGIGTARLLVVGRPAEAAAATAFLQSDPHLGYEIVDICGPMAAPLVRTRMDNSGADGVVVALSGNDEFENEMTMSLKMGDRCVLVIPPRMGLGAALNVQYVLGEQSVLLVDRLETVPLLSRRAKRVFDVGLSMAALTILAVPMAIVAIAVRFDGGPAIFGHERVGEGGRTFRCLKFRSMRRDAQAQLETLLDSDPEALKEWNETRKLRNDPRVTRIGRFIRKTNLDELPQLLNVIGGQMSLVGPRPVTESELARYGEETGGYLSVRPGITGLWQVSGRNDVSYAQRVGLDAWYVKNWSPWHDFAILLKTVPAILSRRGAY